MTKYYPCIIITKDEIRRICDTDIVFKNGIPIDKTLYKTLEDHIGHVIITIQESTRDTNEIFLFIADSQVFYGLTGKRICQIYGTFDTIITILKDIFKEHPEKNPIEIFHNYRYHCSISEQQELNRWIKTICQ